MFLRRSVKCCVMLSNICRQYQIERQCLFGKRLQASVWHTAGTLKRKVLLGEVLIPLDGWRLEDGDAQGFNWYPLCPKVKTGQTHVQQLLSSHELIVVSPCDSDGESKRRRRCGGEDEMRIHSFNNNLWTSCSFIPYKCRCCC